MRERTQHSIEFIDITMIAETPEAFTFSSQPAVLIKMLLKEANQLSDTLQDGLFYLTHRKLLMSIALPLSVIS